MKTQTRIGLAVGLTLALLAAGAARAGVVASGGNYTNLTIPGYRIHVFTNSATASNFYVRAAGAVEVLVVAGGGGGGGNYNAGGGGAGGLIYSNAFPVAVNSNYLVTVGAGGNGGATVTRGSKGGDSVFATITATGGGGGGGHSGDPAGGGNGGSGGGASGYSKTLYGTNLPAGQGNQGGVGGGTTGGNYSGGGGGGAGSIGLNGLLTTGGAGGTGAVYSISGTATYYAGGGGGAGYGNGIPGGAGGLGGGGKGSDGTNYSSPSNAIPNTGGGGGGASGYPHPHLGTTKGGNGGSGIVIVRYATPLGVTALPVSNLQTSGGTLNGIVTGVGTNGAADAENPYVYFCWDSSDKGTNSFPGTWTHPDLMGTNWGFGQSFSTNLTGLSGTTVYRCFASNSTGIAWSDTQSFTLVTAPAVTNLGVGTYGRTWATLRGQVTDTGGETPRVTFEYWPAAGGTTNALDAGTQAGACNRMATLLAPATQYSYWVIASNAGGRVWSEAKTFTTLAAGVPQTATWDNGGGDGKWSTASNWVGDAVPLPGDAVVFDTTSTSNCAANVVSNNLGSLTLDTGYAGTVTFATNAVAGGMTLAVTGDIVVRQGNIALTGDVTANPPYGAGYAIQAANLSISNGASINADGKGFTTAARGPGTAVGKGATHGGIGWGNTSNTYGSATSPTSLGSATAGANGGGAIKLIVSGNLIVNGTLSADGANDWLGSGSGGSIWIATGGTLSGNGTISAKSSGTIAGGGGRIAIDDAVTYNFTGNILCDRAGGSTTGNPGSLRLPQNQAITVVTNQTLVLGNGEYTNVFSDLTITSGGRVEVGGIPMGLGTGSVIRAANLNIQTGGVLTADYRGFGYSLNNLSYTGPGTPGAADKGATHAGVGYSNATGTYGSANSPTSLGSDGKNAFGGGAIKLIVSGNLIVNGTLSANGAADWQGCGSGGSLWIENRGTLSGNGAITANGGGGISGGGGGRIAIYYASSSFAGLPAVGLHMNQQSISSTVTVKGGYNTGADGVEDGSIYIEAMMSAGTVFKFR